MIAKLTPAMVTALSTAQFNHNERRDGFTGYEIMEAFNGRTRKAMHDRGLMEGHYYLTEAGVEAWEQISGQKRQFIAASQAQKLVNEYYTSLDRDAEEIIAGLRAIDPAMTATYYDNSEDVEEVIAGALSRLGSTSEGESVTEELEEPVEPLAGSETDAENVSEPAKTETVCVVQNWAGTVGVNHYHAPGCRDIQREAKRHGASEGKGMYSDSFTSVAAILSHEYSDICENTAGMLSESNSDYAGIKIMPCLSIPFGFMDSRPLLFVNEEWILGTLVEDDETSYGVPSHTRYPHGRKGPEDTTAETEVFEPGTHVISKVTGERGTVVQPYMTGVIYGIGERMPAVTLEMDNGSMQSALIGDLMLKFECKAVHVAPCAEATGENGACCDAEDAGFEETMITREYDLSVLVDETTGATVPLGWVTLTLNAAHVDDHDRIAEEYGRVHGQGTPRHGWASIISVFNSADL